MVFSPNYESWATSTLRDVGLLSITRARVPEMRQSSEAIKHSARGRSGTGVQGQNSGRVNSWVGSP